MRVVLACVLLCAAAVKTQQLVYSIEGTRTSDNFGIGVAGAGDVDRDGFADFIVGSTYGSFPNVRRAARVYSGRTGRLLHTLLGELIPDYFGYAVAAAGDVDGDGHGDVVVGAPGDANYAGYARLYSGRSGALLRAFPGAAKNEAFGCAVAGGGDVNRDGVPDIVVGARNAGYVVVYSGKDGAVLHRLAGTTSDLFGTSVAIAGDVNGDGAADVLVGAPQQGPWPTSPGYAVLVSGLDGKLLYRLQRTTSSLLPGDLFGLSVSSAGDVDKDGRPDVIVGSRGEEEPGTGQLGAAWIFSGRDGRALWTLRGSSVDVSFGSAVGGVGDVDGDGHGDVIVGAYCAPFSNLCGQGTAWIFSGRTGTRLHTFLGDAAGDQFGFGVAGLGDLNGDGSGDWIIGASRWGRLPGIVRVYAGSMASLIGQPSAISLSLGGTHVLALDARPAHAGRAYVVLGTMSGTVPGLAFGPSRLPLNYDGFMLLTLTSPHLLHVGLQGSLDADGRAKAGMRVPLGLPVSLAGRTVHHAFVVLESAGEVVFASDAAPLLLTR